MAAKVRRAARVVEAPGNLADVRRLGIPAATEQPADRDLLTAVRLAGQVGAQFDGGASRLRGYGRLASSQTRMSAPDFKRPPCMVPGLVWPVIVHE